jgi:uncharacterized protein (DUF488 family)
MTHPLYTIGHSNHSQETLIALLRQHGVTAVSDVRSQPYSRLHPQFARERLRDDLRHAEIAYVFLGQELGGRSPDRDCYVDGKVQYERMAQTATFRAGIARLIEGADSYRIAILCAEKDPLACHRTLLVARELSRRGLPVEHILFDGALESQHQAEARLLRELDLPSDDIFRSRAEVLDEAYRRRGEVVGYRLSEDTGTARPAIAGRRDR